MIAWVWRIAALFLGSLGVGVAYAQNTAHDVMMRVQQQLSAPSEIALGEMKLLVYGELHRHYSFALARSWEQTTGTEQVRIDFESPVPLADPDASERSQNRYLLKRVEQRPPTQWIFMPSLRRTRIIPYHPKDRLLQSQLWFYDLTTITDLKDFDYQFKEFDAQHPVIDATPQVGIAPYTSVRFWLERRGETYVIAAVIYVTDGVTREAEYSGYQEIAPGWFRPQRLVVRNGDTERTEILYREWRLNAAVLEVFSGSALETKSLPITVGEGTE